MRCWEGQRSLQVRGEMEVGRRGSKERVRRMRRRRGGFESIMRRLGERVYMKREGRGRRRMGRRRKRMIRASGALIARRIWHWEDGWGTGRREKCWSRR